MLPVEVVRGVYCNPQAKWAAQISNVLTTGKQTVLSLNWHFCLSLMSNLTEASRGAESTLL